MSPASRPWSGLGLAMAAALLACGWRATTESLPDGGGIKAVKVADFPGYTEGIAFDAAGTAYVSAGRNLLDPHAVYRLRPGKPPERWLELRIPNGHKVLSDGSHAIAADGTIVRVSRDGNVLDSSSADRNGVALRRPNDIALDGHGGFYFTDPGVYEAQSRRGRLLYVDSAWVVTPAAEGFCYPNGLVVRADGRVLYLDDSCDGRVYQLAVLGPGRIGNRVVIASLADSAGGALDGMTLDEEGRIYIADNGLGRIEVLDSTGRLLAQYPAGNRLASNVAFGGPDLGDLYITGAPGKKSGPGALYRLRLAVRGRSSMARPAAPGGASIGTASAAAFLHVRRVSTMAGLQNPESARWDPELGVWFVSSVNGHGLVKDGNGYISRLKPDGTVDSLKFVASGRNGGTLHAPKGMAIVGDTLWVADIDTLRAFHRRTGSPLPSIGVPGAKILNDVVVGPDGIYITDTGVELGADGKMTHPGPDRVFRIAGRRVTTAMTFPTLPGPNGITWDSVTARFMVVPYLDSTIMTWMPGDSSALPFATGPRLMDGVEALGDERYLVTSGADSSLNILERGRVTRLADGLPNPGDIGFDRASGRVAVPLVAAGRLEFFELVPAAP